jgi:hypothetical protein
VEGTPGRLRETVEECRLADRVIGPIVKLLKCVRGEGFTPRVQRDGGWCAVRCAER